LSQNHTRNLQRNALRSSLFEQLGGIHLNGPKPPRPSLDELSPARRQQFMNSVGQMVETILPREAGYCALFVSRAMDVSWITNFSNADLAKILRNLAQHLDPVVAEGWDPVADTKPQEPPADAPQETR